jgi:hypothetical protein
MNSGKRPTQRIRLIKKDPIFAAENVFADSMTPLQKINFSRIKQRKIIQLVREHKLEVVNDFFRLNSLCYDLSDDASYRTHSKTFLVKDDIERVWEHYKTISPEEAWNSSMLSFGLLYSKKRHELLYSGDEYGGIEEGQIIFINIRLLGGVLNIAVAHHISEVNEAEKSIRICYLEKGASEGSQWIRFMKTEEGFTHVTHETRYKGKSQFRDANLYPVLHEKAIMQFHQNVERGLLKQLHPLPA